jgi:hypothetical protein
MSTKEIFSKYPNWDKWEPYFAVYDQYFEKYRNTSPVFVEVGVYKGGSIKSWIDYFGPNAKIYGIDIAPLIDKVEGASIILGDQSSGEFWDKTLPIIGDIDCFLDDGGHTMEQQIITFLKVWPKIKNGGVFICEDTHTSYYPGHGGSYKNSMNKNSTTFIEFAKQLIDGLHLAHFQTAHDLSPLIMDMVKDIGQISFYDSMVVFVKGKQPFTRIIT